MLFCVLFDVKVGLGIARLGVLDRFWADGTPVPLLVARVD